MPGTGINQASDIRIGLFKSNGTAKSDVLPAKSAEAGNHSKVEKLDSGGKALGTPGERTVIAGELFKQTAAALGLPKDTLSIVLLAFTRFFSLSPSPAFMQSLRREILASPRDPSRALSSASPAFIEAKALASVIGADKGVILSPEALEQYARFFVPPVLVPEGKDEDRYAGTRSGNGEGEQDNREELPDAEKVRAIAEEAAQNDDIMDFLNTLPGRNGQHWLVFPFKINAKGTELSVFLRVLKREYSSVSGGLAPGEGESLIADIAGPKRQWRFYLRETAGKYRADIRVYPSLSPRALAILEAEAKNFLGQGAGLFGAIDGFAEIRLQNGGEIPSWAEDLCDESLPSVDKEV